ncbi:hypothetical protein Pcinc_023204 [Petrolisthes cinctipes]|uniref:Transmembrane protein n=1 Tax=Petrolisthes cinctipes TaxID=88211 RepID=A0AAE1FE24_PETCI|nr:hypothetical protein Pcinc_024550 [Petrolisthes cinctipes]KAK3871669.1 hypothetical protein Pcinc_023204 [Petrolisthes cinctipes]
MNDTKEEALCNNAQNHRQQLLHHQQELERDLEAGSCADEEEEDEAEEAGDTGSEDGKAGGEEGEEGGEAAAEGEEGEAKGVPKSSSIPPLYNVEPGCTSLGCYSAIATFIVMVIGIVALLMYSSPGNVKGQRWPPLDESNSTESSADVVAKED